MHWKKYQEPISKFLEVLRANPNSKFKLVASFKLNKDIAKLKEIDKQSAKEQTRIKEKFRKLCYGAGANTTEADKILV